jgi:EutQ-like cupin domain
VICSYRRDRRGAHLGDEPSVHGYQWFAGLRLEEQDGGVVGGHLCVVRVERDQLRAQAEPGWRWSEAIKPIAGTDSCEVQHTGYVISGRMHVVMDDGSEQEIGPGDVYVIRPGHDAWIIGDETYVGVDFSSDMERFAKEQQ